MGDRSQQWGSKQSQPSQPSQLPALASLLQRGHTVDQLQDWELQQIVADIDRLQSEKKNKTSDDKANSKAAEGEREQAQPTKKQKQDGDAKDDDTKGTAIEKEANEEDPATKAQQAKEQAKEERRNGSTQEICASIGPYRATLMHSQNLSRHSFSMRMMW